MKLNLFVVLGIILLVNISLAQNSSIKGKVIDEKTGETLPGAIVIIQGTITGGNTDLDGAFSINNIAPGKYTLVCKLISYNTKILTDVVVNSEEPTLLTISLGSASTDLGVVEVTATMSKETTNAMLVMQKNSATVSDGISSETIKRTPDKSTSDVLKRVSGASIQDNKFAIIRGLNDRYNAAYINGAPLPSSESDRKAFAFDIFPSNMLDNLIIIKTATPDLPAEFAGGIIQINTKNIPDKNFQSFSLGSGYNTITTGKKRIDYKGGKTDWLGTDDGTRTMSGEIPGNDVFLHLNIDEQAALAKKTSGDWNLYDKKFSPNFNAQYSFGYTKLIKDKPLGVIMALTYNRTNNYNETVRRAYIGDGITPSQLELDYLDKTYSEQVLAGLLANLSFKWNDNNKFSFKNLYSINSDDKVISRSGTANPLDENPQLLKATARWFTSNKIYSGQLTGEHYLPKPKIRLNWVGSLSQIEREIPNLRRTSYSRFSNINDLSNPDPLDTVYKANVSISSVGPEYSGGMFFSTNKENIYSLKGDVSYDLKTGKEFRTEIKIGGLVQNRHRDFFARQLGYTKYSKVGGNVTFKDSLLYLSDNEIFNTENMGLISSGVGGFKLTDATKPNDAYDASSSLQSAYAMLDNKYKRARLVWGIRIEDFTQKLNAKINTADNLNLVTTKIDVLPSANFIFAVDDKQNVRVSYSQTLNRPEYRELAPFAFYDFNTRFLVTGNDSLRRAKIQNGDVRYEFYPGRGQLFSVSGFYKQFIDPIEQISRADVTNEISFKNAPKAINYGLELEARILLATLLQSDSSKILNSLTVFSNLAIIRSKVDFSNSIGKETRPLQGQSPYILNAGIQYLDVDHGISFSASLNKVGPRIYIVGNVNEPDIWENSRAFLDMQITKSFWKNKMEVKFNAQNILAQQQIFYQNRDFDHAPLSAAKEFFNSIVTGDPKHEVGYNNKEDDLIWSTKFGRVFSASVSFKF